MPIPKWFEEWKRNDYSHLKRDVFQMKGMLYVLVPLCIAILTITIILAMRM